jgi:hypothetical protein
MALMRLIPTRDTDGCRTFPIPCLERDHPVVRILLHAGTFIWMLRMT